VRFDHRDDALGIGTGTPRLSWQLAGEGSGWKASAYELELDRAGAPPERAYAESQGQVLVPWPFHPLRSRERASVRVRVAGNGGWTDWSPPAAVEAGLLDPADWSARFVSPRTLGGVDAPAPVLERTFRLREGIAQARLYITAHGVYVAHLNAGRVGDQVLAPGWTSYRNRLHYQAYDVSALVREGENTLHVLLGNGWFRGTLVRQNCHYGDRLALLAQLEVAYADGSTEVIGTDEEWRAAESGILANDLYDGQRSDLRAGAGEPDDGVEVVDADLGRLTAPEGPPVRVTQVLEPVSITTSPSGRLLVDFGQNLVGWVRLRLRDVTEGAEVVIRHAEVLEGGELGVRPLRSAKATDSYLLPAADDLTLEPSLTFHGFRYAEITGAGEVQAADVRAVVVGSDLRRTGWFSCSDQDLNRLHENAVWSMRGNFLSVPTDCPQRNERLGWTGDIQIFAPTACFLHDAAGFLSSWLADLGAEQGSDGSVPYVIPDVLYAPEPAAAAWGDAATVVPWVLYERYGDARVLERQYASMRAWVERISGLAGPGHVWRGSFQFGDWLDPAAPPEEPGAARTDHDLLATAHLAHSAEIVSRAATVLGHTADAERYAALASDTRHAFAREFATPSGNVLSDAQTAYALAICWNLLPDEAQLRRAGDRLADLVRAEDFRIGTGFVGTPLITDALTATGHADVAYRLLLQRACPSWLYPVSMGATTIWERWDSMLPDGSINPGEMTSFNHYAFGAVADWLHRTVAGLAPAAPGYRHLTIHPQPGSGLTEAAARHVTPYGEAAVAWRRDGGRLHLEATVPIGATATVRLPGRDPFRVGPGHHVWTVSDPVPERASLSPRSTVRQLMDADGSWHAAAGALVDAGLCDDEAELAHRVGRYLDLPAARLPRLVARRAQPDALSAAGERIAKILDASEE
ncbi:MAG: family 78 glycoside hydrolase catalytic domain, partial [Candidatus Dormibacteraeota bacterium]|nr:family 78 glycoside hydrolase catalytic domain [Candidatus Dormibacteraeota bacterium]